MKNFFFMLSLGLFLSVVGDISAQSSGRIIHSGTNEPSTEGWSPIDIVAGTSFNWQNRPGIGPVTDLGVNAWQVRDLNTDPSSFSEYWSNLPQTVGLLSLSYWRMSAHVRAFPSFAVESRNSEFNAVFQVDQLTQNTNPTRGVGFSINLFERETGGTAVQMQAGNFGNPVDLTLSNGYNWIELLYSPVTGQADLYINGTFTVGNAAGFLTAPSANRVRWGDAIFFAGDDGGASWGTVDFEYSPVALTPLAVPEPSTWLLLAIGIAAAAGRFRRRKNHRTIKI